MPMVKNVEMKIWDVEKFEVKGDSLAQIRRGLV